MKKAILALLAASALASPSFATLLDFNEGPSSGIHTGPYFEDGFVITTHDARWFTVGCVAVPVIPCSPDRTPYFSWSPQAPVATPRFRLETIDGAPFDFLGFDIAGSPFGTLQTSAGGLLQIPLATDMISVTGPGWTELSWLDILGIAGPPSGITGGVDNLRLARLPEPSTVLLIGIGALLWTANLLRKKHSLSTAAL